MSCERGRARVRLWAEYAVRRAEGRECSWLTCRSNAPLPVPTLGVGDPDLEIAYMVAGLPMPLPDPTEEERLLVAHLWVEKALASLPMSGLQERALRALAVAVCMGEVSASALPDTLLWRERWQALRGCPEVWLDRLYDKAGEER